MFLCTCLSYLLGRTSKKSFQIFRGFISANDVLLMERNSTVHWMVNN